MSQTGRRRQGHPDERTPAAASRQGNPSTTRPTREQAFDAFCTVLAFVAGRSSEGQVYTQASLPPDVASEDAYLRRHRALRKAGVAGCWMRGKVAACTPEAWATVLPQAPRLVVIAPQPVDHDAEVAKALGIVARRAT